MKGKPNPLAHMLIWGAGSGTILALLYLLFFAGLGSFNFVELFLLLIQPSAWILALQFGGIPGAILGLLTGLVLWALSMGFREPFNRAEMQRHRYPVYFVIGSLTTILGFVLSVLVFGMSTFSYMGILLWFPPFIAGVAAAYAAHRYMFRLRLWTEQQYGIQKEKEKNVEHLEDKAKVEETGIVDGKEENQRHKTS
jgi:hypothetical protein